MKYPVIYPQISVRLLRPIDAEGQKDNVLQMENGKWKMASDRRAF